MGEALWRVLAMLRWQSFGFFGRFACVFERLLRPRVSGSSGFEAEGAEVRGGPVSAAGGIARAL